MKLKYLLSLVSSFFLATTAKSQLKKPAVKKETTPQVKSKMEISSAAETSKISQKGTVTSVPITVKPDKQNVSQKGTVTSVPITVKPEKQNVSQKGTVTSVPITVKPDKQNVSQKGSATSVPITVKPDKGNVSVPDKNLGITSSAMTVRSGNDLFAADFNSVDDGDMPKGWKTNGTGSVITIMGKEGKWLKLEDNTKYETSLVTTLPEKYKIEFDFIANYKEDQGVPELTVRVYKKGELYREPGISFHISPNGGSVGNPTRIQVSSHNIGGGEKFRAEARHLPGFEAKNNKNEPMHVVLSVKAQQVKAWFDSEKVYDLEDVVPVNVQFNRISFETGSYGGPKANFSYYISNIKVTAD